MVVKGWRGGGEEGVVLSACAWVGLYFFRASLFIYLFIIIVMLCVSFFEFILNNLIQHQFYGFVATPGGLSAGSGGEGR